MRFSRTLAKGLVQSESNRLSNTLISQIYDGKTAPAGRGERPGAFLLLKLEVRIATIAQVKEHLQITAKTLALYDGKSTDARLRLPSYDCRGGKSPSRLAPSYKRSHSTMYLKYASNDAKPGTVTTS